MKNPKTKPHKKVKSKTRGIDWQNSVWALHAPDLYENGKLRKGGRSILDYIKSQNRAAKR